MSERDPGRFGSKVSGMDSGPAKDANSPPALHEAQSLKRKAESQQVFNTTIMMADARLM